MIDNSHTSVTLGTWFFWPIFGIGVLLILAATIAAILAASRTDRGTWLRLVLVGAVIAVVSMIIYWPPFTGSYHRWYHVSGTVAGVQSRLMAGGDHGTNQRFVIRFAQSPTLYGCDDTRCSLATPGAQVALLCKRDWQFRGTPGWVCNYDQTD